MPLGCKNTLSMFREVASKRCVHVETKVERGLCRRCGRAICFRHNPLARRPPDPWVEYFAGHDGERIDVGFFEDLAGSGNTSAFHVWEVCRGLPSAKSVWRGLGVTNGSEGASVLAPFPFFAPSASSPSLPSTTKSSTPLCATLP